MGFFAKFHFPLVDDDHCGSITKLRETNQNQKKKNPTNKQALINP
jgi:hypothetical protein